ncbi:hypothetical protein EDD21DRAFT_350978 [Dissophora ornata]|nr:hypothetical protein EDD21DRAFT_350978 [Dissophora ornata]
MVAGHVRRSIQEAVEDGVGELDLSCLELTDLPSEIRDLNFAIVFNERGSFSLSKNRLKLFLSSNQFLRIPMDVFALHNLSVLSIRNNHIDVIPPEIGLLHNLVELSVGGNLLKVLPSQIALLPKLQILTVHPNPFMVPPEPEPEPVVDPHEIIQGGLQVFGGNGGNIANGVDNNNNSYAVEFEHAQNLAQTLLISPPASPPPFEQIQDIDMAPPLDQESSDGESLQYVPVAIGLRAGGNS